jgi:hypothetical protein
MATSEPTDLADPDDTTKQPLTRFANVLGATFIGMAVTGLLLWLVAGGMQMGGGGIFYLVIFLVATGGGYVLVKQATESFPSLRIAIIVAGLGAIVLVSANWRQFGFEDPWVAPAIFAIFVMMAYFFTPGGMSVEPVKSFKDQMEDQLAGAESVAEPSANPAQPLASADAAPAVADEAQAVADAAPASVTMFRKSSMMGMQVDYFICCDGKPIAKIENGCMETVKVPPGTHQFTLTDDYASVSAPISLNLEPGEEAYIDCSFRSLWKGVTFRTVDRAEAERDMEGLQPAATA